MSTAAPATAAQEPFLLKNVFSRDLLEGYALLLTSVWPEFDTHRFLNRLFDETWPALELKERMRHISVVLREFLPPDYAEAVPILVETTRRMVAESGEKLTFEYMFIPDFVQHFGQDHYEVSVPALGEITRWTSAEFAVRPFLLRYPDRMAGQMLDWSRHESPMLRRLSSEGIRPRLPWGMGVPALKKDPAPILPVLENLKTDPAETVRRSVANNLNDIAKDHPDLVLGIARRWAGHSPETDWVVRHACRGLLKKGHPEALALFGFEQGVAGISVEALHADAEVRIGGRLAFAFEVANTTSQPCALRLEYAINYCTLSGKTSRKVFKIKELEMVPGERTAFARAQRFQDFTTRKHYPGTHQIDILVNGKVSASAAFEVISFLHG
ncbi:MAG: DNA alkylation repair protein [Saprospiraceae bacterium]|nr:DNA alkylation repair protein [Saprospiraceae bacterium]